ncbi:MAG: pyridoxamine 5'-phosphate oxidase family protein [Desulfobacterota bacterium]|nr:pyridoxamine 5'-phosphate oxidase family protein [Thermodesulfobacteriota bacterium]
MARLIIPKANAQERAMFERLGIRLVEDMRVEDFEKMVCDYLTNHNVLNLATCRDNEPRCTTLEYFNNGLIVYIFSEGGGKILNIKQNPSVAYTINDPYYPEKDFFSAVGLQVWGRAAIFKRFDDPTRAEEIGKYFRGKEALQKQGLAEMAEKVNYNIITIEPFRIRFLDIRRGFRNILWQKED